MINETHSATQLDEHFFKQQVVTMKTAIKWGVGSREFEIIYGWLVCAVSNHLSTEELDMSIVYSVGNREPQSLVLHRKSTKGRFTRQAPIRTDRFILFFKFGSNIHHRFGKPIMVRLAREFLDEKSVESFSLPPNVFSESSDFDLIEIIVRNVEQQEVVQSRTSPVKQALGGTFFEMVPSFQLADDKARLMYKTLKNYMLLSREEFSSHGLLGELVASPDTGRGQFGKFVFKLTNTQLESLVYVTRSSIVLVLVAKNPVPDSHHVVLHETGMEHFVYTTIQKHLSSWELDDKPVYSFYVLSNALPDAKFTVDTNRFDVLSESFPFGSQEVNPPDHFLVYSEKHTRTLDSYKDVSFDTGKFGIVSKFYVDSSRFLRQGILVHQSGSVLGDDEAEFSLLRDGINKLTPADVFQHQSRQEARIFYDAAFRRSMIVFPAADFEGHSLSLLIRHRTDDYDDDHQIEYTSHLIQSEQDEDATSGGDTEQETRESLRVHAMRESMNTIWTRLLKNGRIQQELIRCNVLMTT